MVTPVQLSINSISPGAMAPAVPSHQAQRPAPTTSPEDILNLVNIDKDVLDVSSLNNDPDVLTKIAAGIVAEAKKNGGSVKLENGRIIVPKEAFDSIRESAEKKNSSNSLIGNPAISGNNGRDKATAGTPPERGRESYSANTNGTSSAQAAKPAVPELSSSQAFAILKDLTGKDGNKYIEEGVSSEDGNAIELGLEKFWKDYGNNLSINGRHSSFTVQPKLLIGDLVNKDVSRLLTAKGS